MKVAIRQPIKKAHRIAASRLVHLFALRFGFVYFEQLDTRTNPSQFVTGFTTSPLQQDRHYMVGHLRGFDLTAVERRLLLTHNSHTSQPYKWLIMQIDMPGRNLPHAFLATYKHSALFYSVLFGAARRFERITNLFTYHEPLFVKHFTLFVAPEEAGRLQKFFTPAITTMLGYHFRQFEYELDGDHLRIYAPNTLTTPMVLQEMLRIGLWLAEHLSEN